jgi:hypothetical protein
VVEHDEPVYHAVWDGRVYEMTLSLLQAGLFNLDEFRHSQERLSAFELMLLEEGLVSPEGLKRRQREYLSMEREDRY